MVTLFESMALSFMPALDNTRVHVMLGVAGCCRVHVMLAERTPDQRESGPYLPTSNSAISISSLMVEISLVNVWASWSTASNLERAGSQWLRLRRNRSDGQPLAVRRSTEFVGQGEGRGLTWCV